MISLTRNSRFVKTNRNDTVDFPPCTLPNVQQEDLENGWWKEISTINLHKIITALVLLVPLSYPH